MISRISRNSKRIIAILSQYRSPAQIALAIAIGIVLGLIPKDNLVVIALVAMIAFLRINQLVACATAIALSFASIWFSPITAAVGSTLLEQPMIARAIGFLYQFPILPWARLENTLVLGGIGLGILTFLPAFAICFWLLSKASQKLESIALEQVANDAIQYRKSVAEQSKSRQEKPLPELKVVSDDQYFTGSDSLTGTPGAVASTVYTSATESAKSTTEASAKLTRPTDRQRKQRTIPTIFTGEVLPEGNDTFLRETVIEVVRYRKPFPTAQESNQVKKDSSAVPHIQGNPMPTGNGSTFASKDSYEQGVAPTTKGLVGQTISYDLSHTASQVGNRDESLKYLLWHINGSKDSVRKTSEKSA
ncbi:MAG: TIGR03546 family protein [Planctomycetota bacterium]|nr:TIGR03546 family protein [Planctomycetota bacterium]